MSNLVLVAIATSEVYKKKNGNIWNWAIRKLS